jgi:hypothetical protein
MFGGFWDITSRHIVKTLGREIAAAAPALKAAPHRKWVETLIGFDASDYPKTMVGAGQLPLLVSPTIANVKLYHILIDGGASLNFISLQEAIDTDGEALAVTPVLKSGLSVGYATRLYLTPGHIRDGRELPHGECPFRCRGGQPPVQRHPGQTSSVPVYGGGSLRISGSKDVIPQWRPQDPGRP